MEKRGPWVKYSPPLRDKDRVLKIRRLLAQGHVDTVGSDHSPFRKEQVEAGINNIWKAEAGMPGIETILPLLINGVSEGWVSLNRIVACLCENPSRIYGFYPRKGVLQVGSDGDIVTIDMKKRRIRDEDLKMKCKWSPFSNLTLRGTPTMTIIRGETIVENMQVIGKEGHDTFVPRIAGQADKRRLARTDGTTV
jgi:dihydroorotase-like cyclic amidohydrolase